MTQTVKRPRFILHLGTSKCGSTSLQYFLNSNYEALLAQGVLVPKTVRGGVNHLGLAMYVGRSRKWPRYAAVQELPAEKPDDFETYFEAQLVREFEDAKPDLVVLSFEGLFRWHEKQIETLMGLLYRLSDDVHAIATLRRHDRWAVSSFNTRLVGHGTVSPDQLSNDRGKPHGILYSQQLDHWRQHMPKENLNVLAFDDHEDILAAHLNALGLRRWVQPGAPRMNIGISAYGQSVLLKYNQKRKAKGIHPDEQSRMRRSLKFVLPTGQPLLPSASDVSRHLEVFKEDRELLKGRYIKPQSRFFEDLVAHPQARTEFEISDEELAEWLERAKTLSVEEANRRRGIVPL